MRPDSRIDLAGRRDELPEARPRGGSTVTVWGAGTPRSDFPFNDDLADAFTDPMGLPDDRAHPMHVDETGCAGQCRLECTYRPDGRSASRL